VVLAPTAVAANAMGPGGGEPPPKKGSLTGRPSQAGQDADEATKKGIERENESAQLLAKNGYDVEQNPPRRSNGKAPDYRINGMYYDCMAPSTPSVRNIASRIKREKIDSGQVDRVVLNLDDTSVTVEAMRKQLLDWPISGLKELIAIKDGKAILLFP